jgi:SAM-dependent methyltransferase
MGSQAIQGKLWGQRPHDWAEIQEPTGKAGYDHVLALISITSDTGLLDIGCGSGYFIKMAKDRGARIVGIDASAELLELARERVPGGKFLVGEMEDLPFEDQTFDCVCGFNSFQYAAGTRNAVNEAKRVLKNAGKLIAMIWGKKEECEAASFLKAIGSLLPAPPPGAPGPFALSENQLLEKILAESGLTVINNTDVRSVWDYPNAETAIKGLISVGPAAKAIEINGFDKVHEGILQAVQPFIQTNGHVVYQNKFRVVISEK